MLKTVATPILILVILLCSGEQPTAAQSLRVQGSLGDVIMGVAMSPNGSSSVTIQKDGSIYVFNNFTHRRIAHIKLPDVNEYPAVIRFTTESRLLCGSNLGRLHEIILPTGTITTFESTNHDFIIHLAVGSRRCIAGTLNGSVLLYDLEEHKEVKSAKVSEDAISSVAIAEADDRAAYSDPHGLQILTLPQFESQQIASIKGADAHSLQFTSDGNELRFITDSLYGFDRNSSTLTVLGKIRSFAPAVFNRTASMLLAYQSYAIVAYSLPSLLVEWQMPLPSAATMVACDDAGQRCLSAYGSLGARLSYKGEALSDYFGHADQIVGTCFLNDSIGVTATSNGNVKVWNVVSTVTLAEVQHERISTISGAKLGHLLIGLERGNVVDINLENSTSSTLKLAHGSAVTDIDYYPSIGVLSSSADSTVILHRDNENETEVWGPFESSANAVRFVDGSTFVIGTAQKQRFVSITTGEVIKEDWSVSSIETIKISKDDNTVYFVSQAGIAVYHADGSLAGWKPGNAPFELLGAINAVLYRTSDTVLGLFSSTDGSQLQRYETEVRDISRIAANASESLVLVGGRYGDVESVETAGTNGVKSDLRERSTKLASTTFPIDIDLPPGTQFTVMNLAGQTLYHSTGESSVHLASRQFDRGIFFAIVSAPDGGIFQILKVLN